ncbi:MAG: phytoene desaturase [Thermohalobaculum sp.]|nr:phytoene desaturase [Thermohalobaculum sp.]
MTAIDRSLAADALKRTRPHAVVIGSGFGGLAAAIRLGARGYRVTVLERLDTPGGRARVFRQDGFIFDAGPTIITLPHLLEELWALAGKRLSDDVELRAMDPFYRIRFDDGSHIDCSGDPGKMRAEVARLSPGDVAGYERLLAASEEKFKYGFLELGTTEFSRIATMFRALPGIIARGGHRTVAQGVKLYLKDPRLQMAFSYHPLLIGGNPHGTTAIYLLILALERRWGVHFAMGGTGALIAGMAGLVEGQGNRLRLGADVAEITVNRGRATGVRLATGEEIPADIVVSNADAGWTWRHLIRPEHRRRWTDRKIEAADYSMGLFVWYFGTDRRWDDVHHHTLVLGPRYKGLLDDIFRHKRLAEDFSLYLHRPTATDPSLAPPGCDAFYALSPVPHLDGGVDWAAQAEGYRARIQARLEETVLPGLGGHVVSQRVVTPHYFHDELLSLKGAGFSLEPTLFQSAWFRPHNKAEGIERLYLVGAGTHPGAGVPGVLTSAQIVADMVPDAQSLV